MSGFKGLNVGIMHVTIFCYLVPRAGLTGIIALMVGYVQLFIFRVPATIISLVVAFLFSDLRH